MAALFGLLSLLGFFVCIVLTIINAIKKKPVKPYAIGIGVCFVLFIVCIAITPDSETETTKQEVAVTETKEEIAEEPTVEKQVEEPVAEEPVEENIAEKYDNDFVASAKLTLDRFIANYDLSLAPQRWTIAKFDDTDTLIGMTDITYQDRVGKFIFVGTLNIENDKVTSVTPHYIEVNGEVLGDDGYCNDVFDTIKNLGIE